jgi:hypothetical protein
LIVFVHTEKVVMACYYGSSCPSCEEFKSKAEGIKQLLSCENKELWRNAGTTDLRLREEEAVASRQAKSLNLRCLECEENEETLKWYQSLYKTSTKSVREHRN